MRHDKTPAFKSFDHTQKKAVRMPRRAFAHRSMNGKTLDVPRFLTPRQGRISAARSTNSSRSSAGRGAAARRAERAQGFLDRGDTHSEIRAARFDTQLVLG